MRVLFIIPLLIGLALSQNTASVEYLRGVRRLDDPSFMDYYFRCSGVGSSLDCAVNDVQINFIGSQNVGMVTFAIGVNITSYASLLSTNRIDTDTYSYESIFVVTTTVRNVNVTVNVVCASGSGVVSTNNTVREASTNPIVTTSTNDVFFQYLLSTSLVSGTLTHIYSCGVNNVDQFFVAGNSEILLLTGNTALGGNNQVLPIGSTVVTQKSLLIAMEPYLLSIVFYLTGPEILDVRCSGTGLTAALIDAISVNESLSTTEPPGTTTMEPSPSPTDTSDPDTPDPSPTSGSFPTSTSTSVPTQSPSPTPTPAPNNSIIIIAIVVPSGGGALIAVVIAAILIWRFFHNERGVKPRDMPGATSASTPSVDEAKQSFPLPQIDKDTEQLA